MPGIWLAFEYRPGLEPPARQAHRVAAVLALPTGLAVPLAALAGRRPRTVAAVAFVLTLPAAFYTGFRLPWDSLALTLVKANADYSGVLDPFGSEVRAVYLDDVVVGLGAYRLSVVEHMLILPVIMLVAWRFLLRR